MDGVDAHPQANDDPSQNNQDYNDEGNLTSDHTDTIKTNQNVVSSALNSIPRTPRRPSRNLRARDVDEGIVHLCIIDNRKLDIVS